MIQKLTTKAKQAEIIAKMNELIDAYNNHTHHSFEGFVYPGETGATSKPV